MQTLLEKLRDEYQKQRSVGDPDVGPFLTFAHKYLNGNPPAGVAMLAVGIGLRLADGTIVSLQQGADQTGMVNAGAIPISRVPVSGGGYIVDPNVVPITGSGRK
jgi:hypothetical protein